MSQGLGKLHSRSASSIVMLHACYVSRADRRMSQGLGKLHSRSTSSIVMLHAYLAYQLIYRVVICRVAA